VNATGLSAQLAYYFLFSLFPFLIFAITLLGYTPITADDVLGLVKQFIPGEAEKIIEVNLRGVLRNSRGGLMSLGAIGAIWSASNAMNAITNALNHAYHVAENRPFLRSRLIALILTLMMILVIVVALILPVFGKRIEHLLFVILGMPMMFLPVWNFTRWAFSFVFMISVFACIYYFAPNKPVRLREIAPGAMFTTIGWQAVSWGFSFYVNNLGHFTATYGGLGAICILMLWFYMIALLIILGGILNATLSLHLYSGRDGESITSHETEHWDEDAAKTAQPRGVACRTSRTN
jgi:membrane protein